MTKVWNNPDVFSIQVELPQNPVRSLNAYVIAAPEQNLLIDTGFNRPKCSVVLWEGILELGHNLKKTSVFLTHLHSDHTGLTGEFMSAGCPIHMGRIDYEHMVGMRTGTNLSGIEALFCQEGCPSDELVLQREQNQGYKYRVKELFPAHLVDDESAISLGPLDVKDATLWPELLIPNKSYIIWRTAIMVNCGSLLYLKARHPPRAFEDREAQH